MQVAFRGPGGGNPQSGRDKNRSHASDSFQREPMAHTVTINVTSSVELCQHER